MQTLSRVAESYLVCRSYSSLYHRYELYKSASFVVQAIAFKQTGAYIKHQKELLEVVSPEEQAIVETFMNLKNGGTVEFHFMSETLFTWSKIWIEKAK